MAKRLFFDEVLIDDFCISSTEIQESVNKRMCLTTQEVGGGGVGGQSILLEIVIKL